MCPQVKLLVLLLGFQLLDKNEDNNKAAGMFGFKQREFFELEDEAQREAPQVKF